MAAPITHIVLANTVFEKYFAKMTKEDFFVGTSFPDIRYLDVIERNKTHFPDVNIAALQQLSAFDAGLKFHSLVDKMREDFMISHKVYSLVPESTFITQALKFFEDQVLYEKYADWQNVAKYFEKVREEEMNYGVKAEDIQRWHRFLESYFLHQPNERNIRDFVTLIGQPDRVFREIIGLIETLKKSSELKQGILEFYKNFEDLIN